MKKLFSVLLILAMIFAMQAAASAGGVAMPSPIEPTVRLTAHDSPHDTALPTSDVLPIAAVVLAISATAAIIISKKHH